MKRTLLALMLVLSLTTLAGCGNDNTVTDKDTANNNPTSSGYQADEDGSVTSNGKTDTTDKTNTTTTKDNVKTDTKGVGDDVKSAADNVVDAADDVVDGAADAVEGVAEGAKDVVNGDDNTNTKTTANSSTADSDRPGAGTEAEADGDGGVHLGHLLLVQPSHPLPEASFVQRADLLQEHHGILGETAVGV